VLLGAQAAAQALPVCDHYSGVEVRMRKSLQLQAEMHQEFGTCVFDVSLDCEDGAPVGGEAEHAALVTELVLGAAPEARVAVRVHPVDHPAFEADVATIAGQAGHRLCHLMVPKVESVADVTRAAQALDAAGAKHLPLHVLIESPAAVHRAFDIAAHPRVQSLSFGLMDFVSGHFGAIPGSAMRSPGQFDHPLVRRAKLEISSAALGHGKVPSHNVTTELSDLEYIRRDAERARNEFGYLRMWSIHPVQIRPILDAMSPDFSEVQDAAEIVSAAADADWEPIRHNGKLQDRAAYRYYWTLLKRARTTGVPLPVDVTERFFTA